MYVYTQINGIHRFDLPVRRTEFNFYPMNTQQRRYKIGAVLVLALTSTLMAELLEGSTPVSRINYLLPQFLFYGPAAILIREITRRMGRGWTTIILLGWAFGITEESVVLQT